MCALHVFTLFSKWACQKYSNDVYLSLVFDVPIWWPRNSSEYTSAINVWFDDLVPNDRLRIVSSVQSDHYVNFQSLYPSIVPQTFCKAQFHTTGNVTKRWPFLPWFSITIIIIIMVCYRIIYHPSSTIHQVAFSPNPKRHIKQNDPTKRLSRSAYEQSLEMNVVCYSAALSADNDAGLGGGSCGFPRGGGWVWPQDSGGRWKGERLSGSN